MGLIKTPIKGTNDYLPAEQRLREYVISKIKAVYSSYGFAGIETPSIEHIENLTGKQGGENEKLIFKILKRGEKLSESKDIQSAVDCGLRYDLTLPLARYYANNQQALFTPFKALQIGNVWRADRPQKGRFRQFTQCDIDILGDDSILAETELISATSELLTKLGFSGFTVRINDRALLKNTAIESGIEEDRILEAFITLDKMDKIGADGVIDELTRSGIGEDTARRYMELIQRAEPSDSIKNIIKNVEASSSGGFTVKFDPTLVRGMGYYTGSIFEITMDELGLSVAGGGRYDEMIGRFGGPPTPACGFSIGFERIITILKDRGFDPPGFAGGICFLIDKKADEKAVCEALKQASELRNGGKTVMVTRKNKNVRFQKDCLKELGYEEFKEIY